MSDIRWANSILDTLKSIQINPKPVIYGQEEAKDQIRPFLKGNMPNTLLLGEPGIGKTALARWIAHERHDRFVESLAPVEPGKAPKHGVWLIDECHRQNRPEPLFRLMENPAIAVIGATTRPDRLDPAFRSRFFLQIWLRPLSMEARELLMADLIPGLEEENLRILAKATAGNPRQAERIATTAIALGSLDPEEILSVCRINADGLNDVHMNILRTLRNRGRPLGLSTLSLMLRTDEVTVADHELLLLDLGLIDLSKSGRTLTAKGTAYADKL